VGQLEGAVVSPAQELLDAAEDEPECFAAALALLVANRADALVSFLAGPGAAALKGDGVWSALRLGADGTVWDLFAEALPGVRETKAHHISALVDAGQMAPDTLLEILQGDSDELAIHAAEVLAWIGRPPMDTRIVEALLGQAVSERRRGPLLHVAVALGSAAALDEIRHRVDGGEPVTEHAIDALAVAGGARDSERLLRLASQDEALAPLALLAAGHLGNRAVASALSTKAEPAALARRASRTIIDEGGEELAGPTSERLLYGKAWTVSGVLARLGEPDELLRARRWFALELSVRTGAPRPAVLDTSARVAVQDGAIARLRIAIENWRRPSPTGAWLYFGKPIA
jgi:hypothetical protein